MRVVLDSNVWVRALVSDAGPAGELVRQLRANGHSVVTSPALLVELQREMGYPRLRAAHGLADERIFSLVEEVRAATEPVLLREGEVARVVASDVDDDVVVATARAGVADVICTLDRDLRHPDVVAYCSGHGIRVLTDVELLSLLRAEPTAT